MLDKTGILGELCQNENILVSSGFNGFRIPAVTYISIRNPKNFTRIRCQFVQILTHIVYLVQLMLPTLLLQIAKTCHIYKWTNLGKNCQT